MALSACGDEAAVDERWRKVPGGSVERGLALLEQYQCGSCHQIPEVPAAIGRSGPSLKAWGRRSYIAGHIPNQPQTLISWLQAPHARVPDTLMPDMGAPEKDARDMAAYLMSLE